MTEEEPNPLLQIALSIATDLTHMSAALLKMAELANVEINPKTGAINVTPMLVGDTQEPTRFQPGQMKAHGGSLAWVFVPPPPYNGVEIVCSPDTESPVGMRCYAEQKLVGGERAKYQVNWEPK
jgi:hypothetical protein